MESEYDKMLAKLESLYEQKKRANEHEAHQIDKEIVSLRARLASLKMRSG